jgi:hypothetical protein
MATTWRTSGDCSFEAFRDSLPAASILRPEARSCWEAARPVSRLMRGMLQAESSGGIDFDAVPAGMKNPLNLKQRGGGPFMAFASVADCVQEWNERIHDPDYAYKGTETVEELINVYAPGYDNNNVAQYVRTIEHYLTALPKIGDTVPPPSPPPAESQIVYGRVPRPTILDYIVTKAGPGNGYFQVAPRVPVGGVRHCTDGEQTLEWYRGFVSVGGERHADALWDFTIDKAGRIAMFNDPFGVRSGWANGNTQGLEGDGPAFVERFGVNAVNDRLFSVEHVLVSPDRLTDPQLEASTALWAWLFDGASNHPRGTDLRVPYTSYPVNPKFGLVTDFEHREFTGKGGNSGNECPGAGVRAQVQEHQAGVRALLKQHQLVGGIVVPEPEPLPLYPPGMTRELASRLYGTLTVSWASQPFRFDPSRSECQAWLAHIREQLKPAERYTKARIGRLVDVIRRGDGSRLFRWSDGFQVEQAPRAA